MVVTIYLLTGMILQVVVEGLGDNNWVVFVTGEVIYSHKYIWEGMKYHPIFFGDYFINHEITILSLKKQDSMKNIFVCGSISILLDVRWLNMLGLPPTLFQWIINLIIF